MSKTSEKRKPTKDSFFKFYLIWPLLNAGEGIRNCTVGAWHRFTGAWYCEHCRRYHGRRVHKYREEAFGNFPRNLCSLGIEETKRVRREVELQMQDPSQRNIIVDANREDTLN